ncbi:MAG TPA: transporter substrate-binding domain-containing protein [Rhabdochlamydiaceae bacterium]|nr:transporter substrate-binding domain-containing protein [Rhabdochlamydiaceae bacterium]
MKFKPLLFLVLCLSFLTFGCEKKKTYDYYVGIDPAWLPLDLPGMEKNLLAFSTELIQEIGQTKKKQIGIVTMSWDNLTEGLQKKHYEGILSSLYPYLFYEKKYSFSDVYLMTGPVLIVPTQSKVDSLSMLKGKEVGVIQDGALSVLLEKHDGMIIRTYDSVPELLNDLLRTGVDAAIVDSLTAHAYIRDLYHGQVKIVTAPLNEQGLRLITLYDHSPALLKLFNQGLKTLKATGRYEELLEKWNLSTK